jgi:hypothetical protein
MAAPVSEAALLLAPRGLSRRFPFGDFYEPPERGWLQNTVTRWELWTVRAQLSVGFTHPSNFYELQTSLLDKSIR